LDCPHSFRKFVNITSHTLPNAGGAKLTLVICCHYILWYLFPPGVVALKLPARVLSQLRASDLNQQLDVSDFHGGGEISCRQEFGS
jgi:hypothetical protein